MLHEPAHQEQGPDHAAGYKTKLGVFMFAIYGLIYLGFVAINLLWVEKMKTIVFAGLNLAVVYGFGLIIFALALALIYNHLCTSKEKEVATSSSITEEKQGEDK